jgi:hypothetical protein
MTRRYYAIGSALLLLWLGTAGQGIAHETDEDLRREIKALQEGQSAIRKQLDEIKTLLERPRRQRPAPKVEGVVFKLQEAPTKGPQTAKLTLIEFTDYQ